MFNVENNFQVMWEVRTHLHLSNLNFS